MSPAAIYAARRYIEAIRNANKRAYAVEYLRFIRGAALEPKEPALSYMAKQAVRMELREIIGVPS